jgi:hypothetical protein
MRVHGTKLGAISTGRGLGDQLYDLAGQVPSLDLNFAGTKTLDSRITFTRASSATFIDSAGTLQTAATDVPRFDHNPTTGESLGLLVEEQKTNLLLRSEEFDNASWSKTASSVTANAIAAPNGTTTADTLIEDTSTGTHSITRQATALISTIYTFSVYAKAASGVRSLRLTIPTAIFGTAGNALFDIQAGTAGSITGTVASSNIVALANGWYRCSATTAASTAAASGNFTIQLTSGGAASYTGDGTSGLHLWGAQLEAAAFPTSYIPTTTAAATRSADVASITGANFSSWYNQTEGTLYAEGNTPSLVGSTFNFFHVNDTTTANNIVLRIFNASNSFFVTDTSVTQVGLTSSYTAFTNTRQAGAYKLNDFAVSFNGATALTDTVGTVPGALTQALIGRNTAGSNSTNGTIKRLTYWPTRLANSTLQEVTR